MTQVILTRKQGEALGLKRFYTGRPCIYGHDSTRSVSSGRCSECDRIVVAKLRAENPVKFRNYLRNWKSSNIDKVRTRSRARYAANPKKFQDKSALWLKNNPEQNIVNCNARRARKAGNGGTHTVGELQEILNLQKVRCAICAKNIRNRSNRHLDHITPISRGGENGRRNLQFLCANCNQEKRAIDQIDFMRTKGRLL